MTAQDLGRRLLAEVEEVGLDEIINAISFHDGFARKHFMCPGLDDLLDVLCNARRSDGFSRPRQPFIELMSLLPGSGKTHLLYYLIAIAVLPAHLHGKHAFVVVVDTDGNFSVPRLARQLKLQLSRLSSTAVADIDHLITDALNHVHVFNPQSLASTVETVRSLPRFLLDAKNHHSFERALSFIALDSASAFQWQTKAELEDSALQALNSASEPAGQLATYIQLASAMQGASKALRCPVLVTSHYQGSLKNASSSDRTTHSFRPTLPAPWHTLPALRLILRRSSVRKLPIEANVEEARRETTSRVKVVEKGRFEVFINEWGFNDRTLDNLRSRATEFHFFITVDGVTME